MSAKLRIENGIVAPLRDERLLIHDAMLDDLLSALRRHDRAEIERAAVAALG